MIVVMYVYMYDCCYVCMMEYTLCMYNCCYVRIYVWLCYVYMIVSMIVLMNVMCDCCYVWLCYVCIYVWLCYVCTYVWFLRSNTYICLCYDVMYVCMYVIDKLDFSVSLTCGYSLLLICMSLQGLYGCSHPYSLARTIHSSPHALISAPSPSSVVFLLYSSNLRLTIKKLYRL